MKGSRERINEGWIITWYESLKSSNGNRQPNFNP